MDGSNGDENGNTRNENFEKAKVLLLGAVDTVLGLANNGKEVYGSLDDAPCTSRGRHGNSSRSVREEHNRLFGFKPSKACNKLSNRLRKGKGGVSKLASTTPIVKQWRRECICLCECDQSWKPSPEEKMKLKRLGLGLKEITFDGDGDADHVHAAILTAYPVLRKCGGYTLLRLGTGSKSLVEIEAGEDGVDVAYLKHILNQAKLYVRPLQCDITEDDVDTDKDSINWSEPMESCHRCREMFTLSLLRKHIRNCNGDEVKPLEGAAHQSSNPLKPVRKRKASSLPSTSTDEPLKHRSCGSATYETYVDLLSESEEYESDPLVQELLLKSVNVDESFDSEITLEELLKSHRSSVLISDGLSHRITVRRSHVFSDAYTGFLALDVTKHLRINFLGESAIDDGGPRREFFMLLMGAIANHGSILDGPPDRRLLRHNADAFKDEIYYFVGKAIVLSILNGGPGPTFFSPLIVEYLFRGMADMKQPCVSDVPDPELRDKISMLERANEDEFKVLLDKDEYQFRYDCGVCKPSQLISFSEKDNVISALCLHYSLLVSLAELEQLKRGLCTLKFNCLMESHPTLLRKAFYPSEIIITADVIQDLYEIDFSLKGTSSRVKEEDIIMTWINYLREIEGSSNGTPPTLSDVMVFLTGCDVIPPLGYNGAVPSIKFMTDAVFPTVSICSLTFYIPWNFPTDFESFKERMDFAILGSQGFFGQV